MTNRNSRTQQTREAEEIHESYEYDFEQKGLLDTTNIPSKPGFVQRWIRTKTKGEDDQNNVFRKINQGWKPRPLSSVPKGSFVPHIDFNDTDVIGIHGMILMERPEKQHEKQAEYNRRATANQSEAVKQNMFNVHKDGSGMSRPTMQNKSSVSKGRVPEIADD